MFPTKKIIKDSSLRRSMKKVDFNTKVEVINEERKVLESRVPKDPSARAEIIKLAQYKLGKLNRNPEDILLIAEGIREGWMNGCKGLNPEDPEELRAILDIVLSEVCQCLGADKDSPEGAVIMYDLSDRMIIWDNLR